MSEAGIEKVVDKLQKEGVTKEDFDKLTKLSNLTPKKLENIIASFDDNKEELSPAEKKLLDILTAVDGLSKLPKIAENFKEIQVVKKEVEKIKNEINKKTIEQNKLNKQSEINKKEAEKNEKKSIEVITKINSLDDEIEKIKTKIEKENKKPDSDEKKSNIKKLQEKLEKLEKEVGKSKEENKSVKEEGKKIDKVNKETAIKVKNIGGEIKEKKKELNEQTIKLSETNGNETEKKKVQEDINKVFEKTNDVEDANKFIQEKNEDVEKRTNSVEEITNAGDKISEEIKAKIEYTKEFIKKMLENKTNLQIQSEMFNAGPIDYFNENPGDIVNIKDRKKLITILKSGECKPGMRPFTDFINEDFLYDLEILELFVKKSDKELDSKDIKDFYKKGLQKKEGEEERFFSLLKNSTLKNFIIQNYTSEEIKKLPDKVKNNELKEKIKLFSKIKDNDEKSEDFDISTFSWKNFDIKKSNEKNQLLDNSLSTEIVNNNEIILKLFQGKDIDKLYQFPKLISKIKNNGELIKKAIFIEPLFYDKFLDNDSKTLYSLEYLDSVLEKSKSEKEIIKNISKVKFNNLEEVIKVFRRLEGLSIETYKLFYNKKMKSSVLNIMNRENINEEMEKVKNSEDIKIMEKVNNSISEYYEKKIIEFKDIYNQSGIKIIKDEKIKGEKGIEGKSILYKNKEFINLLKENSLYNVEIKNLLEETMRGGDIKDEIRELSLKMNNPENFTPLLDKIVKISKKILKEQNKSFDKKELPEQSITILERINFLNKKGKIDYQKINTSCNKFIDKLRDKAKKEGKTFDESNVEQYIELYLKYSGISQIQDQETKDNILRNIRININNRTIEATSESVKKDPSIFKRIQDGDKKVWEDINEKAIELTKEEIKQYEKENGKLYNFNDKNHYIFSGKEFSITEIDGNSRTIKLKDGSKLEGLSIEEFKELDIKRNNKGVDEVGNPEAFKNLINMKDKLNNLGILFAWEKRNNLITVMKKVSPFNQIDSDYGNSNLLTKVGFNNYLKFLIAITGGEYSNSNINNNYNTIRKINNDSIFGEKKDSASKFGPFGQKLVNLKIFSTSGNFTINSENNIKKIIKNKTV